MSREAPYEFGGFCWQEGVTAAAVGDDVDLPGLFQVLLPGRADVQGLPAREELHVVIPNNRAVALAVSAFIILHGRLLRLLHTARLLRVFQACQTALHERAEQHNVCNFVL